MSQSFRFPPCTPGWHEFTREWLRETVPGERFPTRDEVRWGAVLGTIAQVAGSGWDLQDWKGKNYLLDNGSADDGIITFSGDDIIALFFAHDDDRSPWPPGRPPYELEPYLAGMPDGLISLARSETLRAFSLHESWYPLSFEFDPGRFRGPLVDGGRPDWAVVVTSAFWGTGDQLCAIEPWPEVFEHGAWQLKTQLMTADRALSEWQGIFDLSDARVQHVSDVFERRKAYRGERMPLTRAEWLALEQDAHQEHREWLSKAGPTPAPDWEEEWEAKREAWARVMLGAIGIDME